MRANESPNFPLRVVDGLTLPPEYRKALRPGEEWKDATGRAASAAPLLLRDPVVGHSHEDRASPRHFLLWEFIQVDVREAPPLRTFPRYVPCAITLLAVCLERFREAVGNSGAHLGERGLSVALPSLLEERDAAHLGDGGQHLSYRRHLPRQPERDRALQPHRPADAAGYLDASLRGSERLRGRPSPPRPRLRAVGAAGCEKLNGSLQIIAKFEAGSLVQCEYGRRCSKKKKGPENKSSTRERIQLAAIGMEAEFAVIVDGEQVQAGGRVRQPARVRSRQDDAPEGQLVSPAHRRRGLLRHRRDRGRDAGDRDRARLRRARRTLALGEHPVRARGARRVGAARTARDVRLAGFSTHYNVSFELPRSEQGADRTVEKLALLLTHILPVPVMLLAANRRSTGIGVRPRGDRIEITADFTPDAALMIATATLIVGIVREVMTWPSYELERARRDGHPGDPRLPADAAHLAQGMGGALRLLPGEPVHLPTSTATSGRRPTGDTLSLREIAGRITRHFWPSIRRYGDPFTLRLIGSVMRGRAPSLLELDDRPPAYEDVGRLCTWDNLFPERVLPRSRYERVLIRAISGDKLRMDGEWYTPTGHARLVARRLPPRGRQLAPRLLARLPARPSSGWERPYRTGKRRNGATTESLGR